MSQFRQVFTRLRIIIIVILFGVGVATAFFSASLAVSEPTSWWASFTQNLAPEAFGALVTYLLIDLVAERLDVNQRKQSLISQLASLDNAKTAEAIRDLWYQDWLQDGSLYKANLRYANLEGTDLGASDMRKVDFYRANLRDAKMWGDFRGADLTEADLEGAVFERPSDSPLPKQKRRIPDGYNDIYPERALLDETTILPDESRWSVDEGYSLSRFTNSTHKKFWRSERYQSPAYKDSSQGYRQSVIPAKLSDIRRLEKKLDEVMKRLDHAQT